jgi:hypothetical protein
LVHCFFPVNCKVCKSILCWEYENNKHCHWQYGRQFSTKALKDYGLRQF